MGGDKRNYRSFKSYAKLVRLPNLFTAPPDVVLGAALASGINSPASVSGIIGLITASILLYAAGTTLNDYFDITEDARNRPERPLPSGEVSPRQALVLGITLLLGGVVAAWVAVGPAAGAIAGCLALLIVFYNGIFKGSVVGYLFMGSARGLNVLLGTTVAASSTVFSPQAAVVAGFIFLYIAAVTYMAEYETGGTNSRPVLLAMGAMMLAALGPLGYSLAYSSDWLNIALVVGLDALFVGWTGRMLWTAYANPIPGNIGPAVGACILGLTALDAAFATTVGFRWAVIILAFGIPAIGLSQLFDVS